MKTPAAELQPVISPDGKWLAYVSNESGKLQVMIRRLPTGDEIHQISVDGGWEPLWAPNGESIYYRARDGETIYSVSFETEPALRIGRPEVLISGRFRAGNPFGLGYDIAPDGKRFLVWLEPENPLDPNEYDVILNWSEELKELVPVGEILAWRHTGG